MAGPTQQEINDLMLKCAKKKLEMYNRRNSIEAEDIRFEKLSESFEGDRTTRYWTVVQNEKGPFGHYLSYVLIIMCEFKKDSNMLAFAIHSRVGGGMVPVEYHDAVEWEGKTEVKP